jgi:uncharacterized alkaline shock family protein YloU
MRRVFPRLHLARVDSDATVSTAILARYAADRAVEIADIRRLVPSPLHRHRGVRIVGDEHGSVVELHLEVEWGARIPDLGRTVQRRVGEYLHRMTGADLRVNVVVDAVGPPQ